ncbi:methane/ammonia monooxygenase subunit B [Bradyrhizobium niftali]|jgi:methane/ammonia monooxygenase subunit B|uniref:bacterial ammonia monooxygenase, subunit AmoB n=1 Tax=Bradyrhizobium niftali TaxID=2560055 RepID=UPI0038352104
MRTFCFHESSCVRVVLSAAAAIMQIGILTFVPDAALAHGERNQEPFLRMRTAHFYDVKWSTNEIPVNGEIVVTGKFRLFPIWPVNLPLPEAAFLGNGTPGPVLARTESYINGVPAIQSTKLELNRDYEFKTVLKGRVPGYHHVHPMINVMGAGPLLGPGNWLTVTGNESDFKLSIKTLSGETIDNLETWGLGRVFFWHGLWVAIAIVWLVWWLRRPLLLPRFRALTEKGGDRSQLVTSTDRLFGAGLLVATILTVFFGFQATDTAYPRTVPLQGSRATVEPLPEVPEQVKVVVNKSNYDVPGRSLRMNVTLTNNGSSSAQLGEFLTSNQRFINHEVSQAMATVDPNYPKELLPPNGLKVSDSRPLKPGETKTVDIEAADAAWETERLSSLINDPDNTLGGLLFFYDEHGKRTISNVSGPMVPVFTDPDNRTAENPKGGAG